MRTPGSGARRRALVCARALALVSAAGAALLAAPVAAKTTVYVQNNTPFQFQVAVERSGAALANDRWGRGVATLASAQRAPVAWFNRDTGITDGECFTFTTRLTQDGSRLFLLQHLMGMTVGSHLWQALSGPDFGHPWYDDRATHRATWNQGSRSLGVRYRAYFTAGDDDIEYVLQHAYPAPAREPDTFHVLAYNIYMRPTSLFKNGQSIRARLLPAALRGYDAIVFSEAADDDVRAELLAGLRPEYPFASRILGADRGAAQDGGVIVVSRWPIVAEDQRRFGDVCSGSDCLGDKGVLYAKIDRDGRPYHVFGSHTQAHTSADDVRTRQRQIEIIRGFVDAKAIPAGEPVLIAGDLNVDRLHHPGEFARMLEILGAEAPPFAGHGATYDPATNGLAIAGEPSEWLDYVLWSKAHAHPADARNEARILRTNEEWKEFGWERALWDLSDHYPVYGAFRFGQSAGQPGP